MWEFIRGINPPQIRKTDKTKYSHKYLKTLYYLQINGFLLNSCPNVLILTSTENDWAPKHFVGLIEIK